MLTRTRNRFRALTAALPWALAAAAVYLGLSTSRHAPAPRPTAVLTVGGPLAAPRVPAGFLGFSTEYDAIERYAGTDPRAVDPVLLQLIRNLTPGQAPVLRIGGDSADHTWWPVPEESRPPGATYSLDQRWLQVTRALAGALHAKLIFGINLEADSLELASAEADALVRGLGAGAVEALELGNEPELYDSFPWYLTNGHGVTGRPRDSYDLAAFIDDFALFSSAMPHATIAGPNVGGPGWLKRLNEFLADEPQVGLVTIHRYPLQACFSKPGSSDYPTISRLLAPASSTGLAESFAPQLAIAHARGVPVLIDELNTVSCGAVPAVSYTFASALWALETMFEMARVGVGAVNVHTFPGAGYELFKVSRAGDRWRASVGPEYYGLLMFAQAAPPGSRLLGVALAGGAPVRAWATRAPDGRVRVVLVDSDPLRPAVAAVRVPGARGKATLERLRAPGLAAGGGVLLGGQGFGASTATGMLQGRRHTFAIDPAGGRYVIRVPASSAALITFGNSPSSHG